MTGTTHTPPSVHGFDWSTWTPGMQSTLIFVRQNDEVLLIRKKTGLGQGKVNAPGGKVESGESWETCARRELEEELEIRAGILMWVAELRFLMSDYPDILCQVFFTDTFYGEPIETREAAPFWSTLSEIPWTQMWEDDQYWLPRALIGERVRGSFSFEGDRMCSMHIERCEAPSFEVPLRSTSNPSVV